VPAIDAAPYRCILIERGASLHSPGLYCYRNCVQVRDMTRSFISFLHRLWGFAQINRQVVTVRKEGRSNGQQQKLKIIRRDRYRCRGCDKRGDERSLRVHPIQPELLDAAGMLALCPNCQGLANANGLTGIDIPDFLRHLWRHLYHSSSKPIISENAIDIRLPKPPGSLQHPSSQLPHRSVTVT
jgi:hypothetical protein